MEALAPDPAAVAIVKELREENASWRTRTHAAEHALAFYINKYPLGDLENFHVSRAAMAKGLSEGRLHGPYWDKYAGYEKAWIDAHYKAQGDQVSGQDGGFLAPEDWNRQWFDLLRNFTVLDRLPITRYSVPLRISHLPKITNDVTVSYPAENAGVTATQYKFGQLTYTARKSEAFLNVSNELIRDAAGVADQAFRQSTAQAIAVDRDTQLILGTGYAGAPTGLIAAATASSTATIAKYYPGASATTDISTTPAHATPSFFHVSSLRSKITSLNGSTNTTAGQARCTGIIAHSRFEKTVHVIATAATAWTDGQGRPLWMGGINSDGSPNADGGMLNGASLFGVPFALTNTLPTNSTDGGGTTSSFMVAGYWQRYALFECLTPTYDATVLGGTATTGFAADQTQIRVVYRYDGSPIQPEAFAVLAGCDQ